MRNKSISLSRILSYVTLGTALIALVQTFQAPDPAHALAHALNAAAYLLLSLLLLFRPGQPVLYVAVVFVSICAVISFAQGPYMGQDAIKTGLLELFTALLAGGAAEWQAWHRESA